MNSVNNNSTKFMRAALGGLLLVLFISGIFMVVEQSSTSKDGQPAESNKKWFGMAYIILAGLLGIYYTFKNIVGSNNSGGGY